MNWNGIHTYLHTHMLVYINRYSVKTGGTVTLGSYKVHLSIGTKCDQAFKKRYLPLMHYAGNSKHVFMSAFQVV